MYNIGNIYHYQVYLSYCTGKVALSRCYFPSISNTRGNSLCYVLVKSMDFFHVNLWNLQLRLFLLQIKSMLLIVLFRRFWVERERICKLFIWFFNDYYEYVCSGFEPFSRINYDLYNWCNSFLLGQLNPRVSATVTVIFLLSICKLVNLRSLDLDLFNFSEYHKDWSKRHLSLI